jgi:trans-aconitate 2-methyltransferase
MTDNYTFGDNDRASARLRRLAELYEPESRDLLARCGSSAPRLAVDLGCGPGWSTRLVRDVLAPVRTVGVDASERYVAEARRRHGGDIEFEVCDVTRSPFPVEAPDLLVCRFLLTHLRDTKAVLDVWAENAAPGARLLVHETESLASDHPALRRYYELISALQAHYGQALHIGARLDACFAQTKWRIAESRRVLLEKPAASMAELHLANIRTWRQDAHARRALDAREIDRLDASLERIAKGEEAGGVVVNAARQIFAVRH